jgi:hypothetical protein
MNAMKRRFRKWLNPQPRRETVDDGPRGPRDAGVPHEEILHGRKLSHCLGYGDADDGEHRNARQGPQHIDPTPANPNLGHDASPGRQPVVQENTIVRRAEARLDGIVREWSGMRVRHGPISSVRRVTRAWPGMTGFAASVVWAGLS